MLHCFTSVWLFVTPLTAVPPGSSVHRILQARILEGVAMPSSRGSFQPRDWTCVSCSSSTLGKPTLQHDATVPTFEAKILSLLEFCNPSILRNSNPLSSFHLYLIPLVWSRKGSCMRKCSDWTGIYLAMKPGPMMIIIATSLWASVTCQASHWCFMANLWHLHHSPMMWILSCLLYKWVRAQRSEDTCLGSLSQYSKSWH